MTVLVYYHFLEVRDIHLQICNGHVTCRKKNRTKINNAKNKKRKEKENEALKYYSFFYIFLFYPIQSSCSRLAQLIINVPSSIFKKIWEAGTGKATKPIHKMAPGFRSHDKTYYITATTSVTQYPHCNNDYMTDTVSKIILREGHIHFFFSRLLLTTVKKHFPFFPEVNKRSKVIIFNDKTGIILHTIYNCTHTHTFIVSKAEKLV